MDLYRDDPMNFGSGSSGTCSSLLLAQLGTQIDNAQNEKENKPVTLILLCSDYNYICI